MIHYYAYTTYWDTTNLDYNEDKFKIIDEQVMCNQGKLKSFLKLPIERVRNMTTPYDENALKLFRKSQILTTNDYMSLHEQ